VFFLQEHHEELVRATGVPFLPHAVLLYFFGFSSI
jgi:hypothetical protein